VFKKVLTENALRLHYKDELIYDIRGLIAYYDNYMIIILCDKMPNLFSKML